MPDPYPKLRNLNTTDVSFRRAKSVAWIMTALLVFVWLTAVGAAPAFKVLVSIPFFIGCLNALSARSSFCVRYGLQGLQSFDDERVEVGRVMDPRVATLHEKRAKQIVVQAFLLTVFFVGMMVLIL